MNKQLGTLSKYALLANAQAQHAEVETEHIVSAFGKLENGQGIR